MADIAIIKRECYEDFTNIYCPNCGDVMNPDNTQLKWTCHDCKKTFMIELRAVQYGNTTRRYE